MKSSVFRWFAATVGLLLLIPLSVGCTGAPPDPCAQVTCDTGKKCVSGICEWDCQTGQTECADGCVDTKSDNANCGACTNKCGDGNICKDSQCTPDCKDGEQLCNSACVDTKTDDKNCGACGTTCDSGKNEKCTDGSCKVVCPDGQTECSGECFDTKTENQHCGACGTACKDGEICKDGTCELNCTNGTTACTDKCVNTQSDRENCGACGTACKTGEVCSAGKCALSCQEGLTDCSGSCANTKTDNANCGGCGTACKAGEACKDGKCELSCPTGETACTDKCADLQTDNANCGKCGETCKAGEVCSAGKCALNCQQGLTDCSGTCTDLQTSNAHCGACGTACKAGEVCSAGKCAVSCQTGLTDCTGKCIDLQTSAANCGACGTACKAGEVCNQGKCAFFCPTGQTKCGTTCINTNIDPANCGACTTACKAGEACVSGSCKLSCPPKQQNCSGTCADVSADVNNCGGCGSKCSGGKLCISGSCGCPTGTLDCSGTCANTQADRNNCGACGTKCKVGEVCNSGKCEVSCPAPQTACSGLCTNTKTDNNNCGACGTKCTGGKVCVNGGCACPTGRVDCTGVCVDSQNDVNNCGKCGTKCSSSQTCSSGICTNKSCPSGQISCSGVCRDPKIDNNNCGACGTQCTNGKSCNNGTCACQTGQTDCSGACVNTKFDVNNCGQCGKKCGSGQVCVNGQCSVFCQPSQTNCSGTCTDTQKDNNNCGACGTKCKTGETCTQGACCGAGLSNCSGACYDLQKDAKHCGTCGNACPPGAECKKGNCIITNWAVAGKASGLDYGYAVAVDPMGEIFVAGSFSTSLTFGSIPLSSKGSNDIFVAKFDQTGQPLWAVNAGGTSSDYAYGIAADAQGNAVLTGYFGSSSIVFGGTTLTNSGNELFIAKINGAGTWMWAKKAGGTASEYGYGIAVDSKDNVYVVGQSWSSTMTFGTTTLTNAGTPDVFVTKLDTTGKFLWTQNFDGNDTDIGNGVAVDPGGNVYITGGYQGTLKNGSLSVTGSTSDYRAFVAKLDGNGKTLWLKDAGHTGSYGTQARAIATDKSGNAYLTGTFEREAAFGSFKLSNSYSTTSYTDIFVAKISGTGNWMWAKRAGDPETSYDYGYGIKVDGFGNVYVTGYFEDDADFGSFKFKSQGGGYDVFVAKLDSMGNWLDVKTAGGSASDYARGIDIDSKGNAYITGYYYSNPATFHGSFSLTTTSTPEVFVARYYNAGCVVSCSSGTTCCGGVCKDTKTDALNCGACGKACSAGSTCSNGTCGCPTGTTFCSAVNACVNTQTDNNNCGGCGVKCGNGSVCKSGSCSCPTGLTRCGTACVNTTTDVKNCGACNTACSSGQVCQASKCIDAWAINAGDTSTDYGYGIDLDSAGNAYVTGYYYRTITFGTTTYTSANSSTSATAFVAKFDKAGKLLKFSQMSNGTSSYGYGRFVKLDSKGNVYVTGRFYGTAGKWGTYTMSSRGSGDVFVTKLDKDLNPLAVFTGGSSSTDYAYRIAVDSSDNVYVTGRYYGSTSTKATFGTYQVGAVTTSSSTEQFVAKFDTSLKLVKFVGFGCKSSTDYPYGLAVDSKNNVYVAGYWYTGSTTATTILTIGTTSLTGNRYGDIYVAKFDKDLVLQKAIAAKGGYYYEYLYGLTIDSKDNLYIGGYWSTSSSLAANRVLTFGTYTLTNNSTSTYSNDIFVAKLDTNLNFTAASNFGSTSSDYLYGIDTDGTNVYLTGYIYDGAKFGTTTLKSAGGGDIFSATLDSTLKVLKATSGGGTSTDYGYHIKGDGKGNTYISGRCYSGNYGGVSLTTKSGDICIFKNLP